MSNAIKIIERLKEKSALNKEFGLVGLGFVAEEIAILDNKFQAAQELIDLLVPFYEYSKVKQNELKATDEGKINELLKKVRE